MGVFDYLQDQQGRAWQTKDFATPNLEIYRITSEGFLEKGTLPRRPSKYYEDMGELTAAIEAKINCPPQFSWNLQNFSGIIRAIDLNHDGKLIEVEFEFQAGYLTRASAPRVA